MGGGNQGWGALFGGSLSAQSSFWFYPQGGKGERGLTGPSGPKGEKGARVSALNKSGPLPPSRGFIGWKLAPPLLMGSRPLGCLDRVQ